MHALILSLFIQSFAFALPPKPPMWPDAERLSQPLLAFLAEAVPTGDKSVPSYAHAYRRNVERGLALAARAGAARPEDRRLADLLTPAYWSELPPFRVAGDATDFKTAFAWLVRHNLGLHDLPSPALLRALETAPPTDALFAPIDLLAPLDTVMPNSLRRLRDEKMNYVFQVLARPSKSLLLIPGFGRKRVIALNAQLDEALRSSVYTQIRRSGERSRDDRFGELLTRTAASADAREFFVRRKFTSVEEVARLSDASVLHARSMTLDLASEIHRVRGVCLTLLSESE